MSRVDQIEHNTQVVNRILQLIRDRQAWRAPSYLAVVDTLNAEHSVTSRGNAWTPKRLFRMLQRQGISGLHGLCAKGINRTP